ncbi:MAG: hypothetical protein SGI92_19650 [Bryobacteraceae bacterium]|nr:hypothetical protein [Bryobacteraceae bacterium]
MRYLLFLFCAAAACFAQQGYSVETLAGNGIGGFSGDGGPASRAQLNAPTALALDSSGRLYIADTENRRVRRVETNGRIATVATSDDPITDIAVDIRGTLFIASGAKLRSIAVSGADTLVSGPGGGFNSIGAIAAEPTGTVLVADGARIYRVASNGITDLATLPAPVTSLYSGNTGAYAIAGEGVYLIAPTGAVSSIPGAKVASPSTRVAADRWGDVYLSGIRITKVIAGKEYSLIGLGDPGYSGDGGPSVSALVNSPMGLTVDRGGNVFFADTGNQRVRFLRPGFTGTIESVLPPDGSQDIWPKDVTLRWTTLLNATSYAVMFGTSPDALTNIGSTSGGSLKLGNDLADRTRYYWQIRTQFPPQPPTESPLFSFTTTTSAAIPPPRPSAPAPPNNSFAQSTSPIFSWTGGGAIQYILYAGTSENNLQQVAGLSDSRITINGLAPETTYYWQVVSFNEVGGTASAIWNFTTGPVNGYPWVIETIAGAPLPVEDGRQATETVVNLPRFPTADTANNVYFVTGDRAIRRVGTDGVLSTTFTLTSGTLTALSTDPGNGQLIYATADHIYRIDPRNRVRTYATGQIGRRGYSGDNGPAAQAVFDGVSSVAADRRGNLYIADSGNNRVRVLANGQVRTFAGTGTCGEYQGPGPAASIPLCSPSLVAVDTASNVYVYASNMLLRIDQNGRATRIAGNGQVGFGGDGGPAVDAQIGPLSGLAVDRYNYIYLSDSSANTIRIIDPEGLIATWAGRPLLGGGFTGEIQPVAQARFFSPDGIGIDTSDLLLIADTRNHRVRRVDGSDVVRTVAGMDTMRGDRGNSVSAYLYGPSAVAIDPGGNTFIADSLNNRVRRVTNTRSIDTVAGGGNDLVSAAATGRDARDLRLDLSGNAALAMDERSNLILNSAIAVAASAPVDAPTQAVIGIQPNSIVGSLTLARLGQIGGIARGRVGEIYVSDSTNHRVYRIGPDGNLAVIAGTGSPGASGDGGQAVTAQLNTPRSLALNPDGELFIAEVGRVRKISASGTISTAAFENATGLAFDKDGALYIAAGKSVYLTGTDRRFTDTLGLVRIAGRENGKAVEGIGSAVDARVTDLRGLAAGPSGELAFADYGENAVRRLTRNIPSTVTMLSGDGQSVTDKFTLPQPLRITVSGRSGVPIAGITVRFVRVAEGNPLSLLGSALTDAAGVATFNPYLPDKVAEVVVEARVFGVTNAASFKLAGRPPE